MNSRHDRADVMYHGYLQGPADYVIVLESPDGERIGALEHVVRHSPSGFNWGYVGAGPCDTALSLFIDAMGDASVCPACQGTERVVYVTREGLSVAEPFDADRHTWSKDGWPCTCSGGYRHLPYGKFVDEFVVRWGDEWIMSRASILSWLAAQAEVPADLPDA